MFPGEPPTGAAGSAAPVLAPEPYAEIAAARPDLLLLQSGAAAASYAATGTGEVAELAGEGEISDLQFLAEGGLTAEQPWGPTEDARATEQDQLQEQHVPGVQSSRPLVIIPLCRKGDRVGIERQLQAGASVEEMDIEGNTPLHVAVEAPRNEVATVQCVLAHGANPNARNYIGAAPLHYVCLRKSNQRGIANVLLEYGAMIDCQTFAGKTPLHFASESQLLELVEMFCLFGADKAIADTQGNVAMHLAVSKEGGRDTVKRQILEHLASQEAGVNVANHQGFLPIHYACLNGYIRCAQFLLEQRANVQAVTARFETCLHLGCRNCHTEIVQLLLMRCQHIVDIADIEGNTALHCCAMVGSLNCAVLLLKAGANTGSKNAQKKTAFELSKIRGTDLTSTHNPELVQVLKECQNGGACRQT